MGAKRRRFTTPTFEPDHEAVREGTYLGPVKFRGRCEHCGGERRYHCTKCFGCPPMHVSTCRNTYGVGTI